MRLVTNLTKLATGIEDDMKLEKKNYKSIALIFIITSVLILIDQYVKYIADTNLKLYEYNPVIGDIFGIEYCRNEGIAWGMFQGKVNFITILTSIITVVMIWFIFHIELYINHLKEKISSDTEEKNTANTDINRTVVNDGPKVGSVDVSPRGGLRMPSDACATVWVQELEELE